MKFVPEVLSTYHTASMFENQAGPHFTHDAFMVKAGTGPDQCTECAECQPRCPQNIPIIEMLAKAQAHLTGSCQIGSTTPSRVPYRMSARGHRMSPDTYSLARVSSFRTLKISHLVLACSLAASCTASYTFRFTAAEIEQSLNRKLPISKSKFLVRATVQSLEVALMQGPDRIVLRPQVEVSIAGQSALTGRALVEGQIRYAPDTGEFFFDAPRMVEVSVGGIPESMRQHAEDLIATCAEAYLTITPVYRLNQTDFKQSLARMFLKSVKVRDGQLQVVIGMP